MFCEVTRETGGRTENREAGGAANPRVRCQVDQDHGQRLGAATLAIPQGAVQNAPQSCLPQSWGGEKLSPASHPVLATSCPLGCECPHTSRFAHVRERPGSVRGRKKRKKRRRRGRRRRRRSTRSKRREEEGEEGEEQGNSRRTEEEGEHGEEGKEEEKTAMKKS